ncbi:MAG: adenosine-specific kinase [Candidatus Cloacimonetes bacterium]|nr:adenosine-specific kinase [Candidatus Cloacimonadota bacterium]
MDTLIEPIEFPEGCNIIFGMSHFIKTVEDLYEALVNSMPGIRFGLAFNEASGPCLVRSDGTDDELVRIAEANMMRLGAGHTFLIILRNCFPIHVMPAIKAVREVAGIHCATANPVQVLLAQTDQGRAVLGVIDGSSPIGVEGENDKAVRHGFLRTIGYKR